MKRFIEINNFLVNIEFIGIPTNYILLNYKYF